MKNAIATLLMIGAVLGVSTAPLQAAPARKPAVAAKSSSVKKPVKTPVKLGAHFTSADFDRIAVGNQAGILKIYSASRAVVFLKEAPGTDMLGVDGAQWAPISDKSRRTIFSALNIGEGELEAVSQKLMSSYRALPQGRTAIAMLGLIGSTPTVSSTEIRRFLSGLLKSEKDVVVRRQAVLALALCADTDEAAVRSVIAFMTASHNSWETFTTRQFFEYHQAQIRSLPNATEFKRALQASGSPYSGDIIGML